MTRFLTLALSLTMFAGVASADRNRHDHQPSVRDHRENRPAQRHDRRVLVRQPVRINNGRYVFGGVSHVYVRPVFHTHYYDRRMRPRLVVENYTPQPGYIWVRGSWNWTGREWQWGDGYYAADPQYSNYYDDGSYDYSVNVHIGG